MKAGDTALIATQPGFEFLTIIYACMLLETKVAIVDPQMGRDLYKAKLKQLKPDYGFIDSRLLLLQEHPILRWIYKTVKKDGIYVPYSRECKIIATGMTLPILQKHQKLSQYKKYHEIAIKESYTDFEFMIVYTSGTLSEPKAVVHSVNSVYKSMEHIVRILQKNNNKRLATHLPHFMLLGICAGIEVFLTEETWSTKKKIDFIERHTIDTLFGPPAEYLQLMDHCTAQNRRLPACLKQCLIGSAPVHKPFLANLDNQLQKASKITCLYGMTEHLIAAQIDGREKLKTATKGDLLGHIAIDVQIIISKTGEILIHSDQLFTRYLHKANREKYHPTGDLGYIDKKGRLVLTGRKKDMIIRKNFNIYPALYEPTIKKIEGVEEAVLIGVYSEEKADETVKLFIESKNTLDRKAIFKQLKAGHFKIDKEALPDDIIFTKIPRKGRQMKIDRKKLQNKYTRL